MSKPTIDLPLYATFTVVCEGKEAPLVVVPRYGCRGCFLKRYKLCADMCCSADERRDGEDVQFIIIEATASPVVLNTEPSGDELPKSEVEGGEKNDRLKRTKNN